MNLLYSALVSGKKELTPFEQKVSSTSLFLHFPLRAPSDHLLPPLPSGLTSLQALVTKLEQSLQRFHTGRLLVRHPFSSLANLVPPLLSETAPLTPLLPTCVTSRHGTPSFAVNKPL